MFSVKYCVLIVKLIKLYGKKLGTITFCYPKKLLFTDFPIRCNVTVQLIKMQKIKRIFHGVMVRIGKVEPEG